MSLLTNLEAFFRLQGDSLDSSGNGHHGTDTSISYGADGAAFGTGSKIVLASAVNLQAVDVQFSIGFILKPVSLTFGAQQDVISNNSGSEASMALYNSGSSRFAQMINYIWGSLQTTDVLVVGTSTKLLFTYSNTGVWHWYVNGTSVATGTNTGFTAAALIQMGQGASGTHQLFANLQYLGCWSRELSSTEVTAWVAGPDLYPPTPNWLAKKVAGASAQLVNDWLYTIDPSTPLRPMRVAAKYKRRSGFIGSFRIGFQCLDQAGAVLSTVWGATQDFPSAGSDTLWQPLTHMNLALVAGTYSTRFVAEGGVAGSTAHSAGEIWFDSAYLEQAMLANLDQLNDGSSYARINAADITGGSITQVKHISGALVLTANLFNTASQTLDAITDGSTYGKIRTNHISSGYLAPGKIFGRHLSTLTSYEGPPNGKFAHVSPEAVDGQFDCWDIVTSSTWGSSKDLYYGTSTTDGLFLKFLGTAANPHMKSKPWGVKRGATTGRLHAVHIPHGTLSSGRGLWFRLNFYAEETLTTTVGGGVDIEIAWNAGASETLAENGYEFTIPAGANFVVMEIYKTTASSAYSWDLHYVGVETSVRVGQDPWLAPTFAGNWVNVGSVWSVAGYMMDSIGFVRLRGLVKFGTGPITGTIFTLPSNMWPKTQLQYPVRMGTNVLSYIQISTAGVVTYGGGVLADAQAGLTLDGVNFDTRS